jgi:type I restriction enzyme R subunit
LPHSIHLDADDLDYTPFDFRRWLKAKCGNLFGEQMDEIINELNEALAA